MNSEDFTVVRWSFSESTRCSTNHFRYVFDRNEMKIIRFYCLTTPTTLCRSIFWDTANTFIIPIRMKEKNKNNFIIIVKGEINCITLQQWDKADVFFSWIIENNGAAHRFYFLAKVLALKLWTRKRRWNNADNA